ncbi:23S rRNA (uracil-5-)-methyltransferase RumA [Emergomyces africanus]|uniref:tRNA (uracil(54)-C(5))-methyltransferase n=1 Tax=Emergomyces africanus TaxID=1955775 RepID=A0A1B7P1H0_9EURO|nr:23S rRNA (uracil-5-)-methyltransferase RumA [Emergomyces africanus]
MFNSALRPLLLSARRSFEVSGLHSVRAYGSISARSFRRHHEYQSLQGVNRMHHNPNRKPNQRGGPQHKKKKVAKDVKEGDTEQVLRFDVEALLKKHAENSGTAKQGNREKIPTVVREHRSENFPETDVTVCEISSTGDGLALSPSFDHVYVVPFTLPGDRARVKVVRTMHEESYSVTDLLEVITPSPQRNDSLIKCQYFAKCGGCQFQMLPYEDQLKHKKRTLEKAYANFSGLLPELIPAIRDTMGSPLQYGYRTKLTPHFPMPSRIRRASADGEDSEIPPIGFMLKGRRTVIDIEDCPLGTDIVRLGMKSERKRVAENLHMYCRGATLLLRESTTRVYKNRNGRSSPTTQSTQNGSDRATSENWQSSQDEQLIRTEYPDYIEEKRCITDQTATSIEYVDDYRFQNKAGQFFQNNNSILTPFTQYIRDNALGPPSNTLSSPPSIAQPTSKLKYLLDAYSGSGLFTVTLSPLFLSSLGIDIAPQSIEAARLNARANKLPNTGFAAADAAAIFKDVPYPPEKTLLVIDPPRKGCDNNFLQQLLSYGPARVVYVSCNVHTQARDVGVLVQGGNINGEEVRYDIESIKGFDFFPQTGHVEGVAILNKVVGPHKRTTVEAGEHRAVPAAADTAGLVP